MCNLVYLLSLIKQFIYKIQLIIHIHSFYFLFVKHSRVSHELFLAGSVSTMMMAASSKSAGTDEEGRHPRVCMVSYKLTQCLVLALLKWRILMKMSGWCFGRNF
jgi:hypothetical protein